LALATVRLLVDDAELRGATLVASLHAVDLALKCFTRIVGIKAGKIAFDLPATDVTEALLHALYASEGQELPMHNHPLRLPEKPEVTAFALPTTCR
jgi:phosphonate transport system ATP-binding protein